MFKKKQIKKKHTHSIARMYIQKAYRRISGKVDEYSLFRVCEHKKKTPKGLFVCFTLKICLWFSVLMPRWTIASTVSSKQSSGRHKMETRSQTRITLLCTERFSNYKSNVCTDPRLFSPDLAARWIADPTASSILFSARLWPLSSSEKQCTVSVYIWITHHSF